MYTDDFFYTDIRADGQWMKRNFVAKHIAAYSTQRNT